MAELLAANQITIAKVLDGEPGEDGYSPTVTTGTSSDGSTTVTVTNKDGSTTTALVDGTARADIDNLSDKTSSGYIETLSGSGFVQSTKAEDGGASEVVVYGKSVQDGTPWIGTEIDSIPYLNRAMPSQGNDYNRESLKIVGGTVAWNQLAIAPPAGTLQNITFTRDIDKTTVTMNGTATAVVYKQFSESPKSIVGHVYLVDVSKALPGVRIYNDSGGVVTGNGKRSTVGKAIAEKWFFIRIEKGATIDNVSIKPNIFDLTQMFGSTIADYIYSLEQSQAGAGVAWFKKLFPNDYYAYNAGELLSVEGLQSHNAVGFNQWDEEWEVGIISTTTGEDKTATNRIRSKGYNRCVPDTDYYIIDPVDNSNITLIYYNADKVFVGQSGWKGNQIITTPSNAYYFRFYCGAAYGTTYNHDICINLSNPTRNGEYEPYEKHSYPLDSSLTLRGIPKLDASNNLYYDGDEYTSDGKVKRRIRTITFNGSENWTASSNPNVYYLTLDSTTFPYRFASDVTASSFSEFSYKGTGTTSEGIADKQFYLYVYGSSTIREIAFKDSACADLSAWKAKLQANPITVIYETNPTTETAQAYTNLQVVDPDGTEEFVSTGILPVGHNSTYLLVCPISVCDNVIVSVKGKNWLDSSLLKDQVGWNIFDVHLKPNTAYTMSSNLPQAKTSELAAYFIGGGVSLGPTTLIYDGHSFTMTTPSDGIVRIQQRRISGTDSFQNYEWQIELGSTATPYEPYQAKTATLSDIVLRSTPDGTRDKLFKDTDGLWKVERNCAYISSYNGESITTSYYSNTGELSTGASVVYALEVPTYETLSDSIQAELNALTTYNPVTNVIASDGVTPDIDVSFWTRDYYAKNAADNAAKVATNFLGYDSTNGLIIGNKTSGKWSGYRSQILPGSFNVLAASSTVLASFGPTTVIGEEAKANLHLTFNNFSMVDKNGTKFFEVGDTRNAEGIATVVYKDRGYVYPDTGSAVEVVYSRILSIVSVYVDSVEISSSSYSFSGNKVTINGLTPNTNINVEITYTTLSPYFYLTFGNRLPSSEIGMYSVAEGRDVTASGYASHAEGMDTIASEQYSHAEGLETTASSARAHAEGWGTTASGNESHAEGYNTTASSGGAHAEGRGTTASHSGAHAEGGGTTANGNYSHAEGYYTTANGYYSHAEGNYTIASGESSHAGGDSTVADNGCMTAIGKYNTKNSGKAFAIGNGTSDTDRSDAFTVDWDGNTVMEGGLTLGTALSIADGGTGATTAAAARSNLGINASNLGIKDYVVEEGAGTASGSYYRKWASGRAEYWHKFNPGALTIGTARGNMYSGAYFDSSFESGLFNDVPQVNCYAHLGTYAYVIGTQVKTISKDSVTLRLWASGSVASNSGYNIHIYALGTWK